MNHCEIQITSTALMLLQAFLLQLLPANLQGNMQLPLKSSTFQRSVKEECQTNGKNDENRVNI